jgi:radical SAM protein with 4Fe4S-binding SPASM domain
MAEEYLEFIPETEEAATGGHRPVVYWYPSFRCNLSCLHCSVNSSPTVDTSNDLTTEEAMKVVDQLKELNTGRVILSGGEILFRHDTLKILEKLIHADINVGLESNGLLFSKDLTELVHLSRKRGVKFDIAISLDGGTEETHEILRGKHTFKRTLKGMRFLADEGIDFTVQCVLNRSNIQSIPNLFSEMVSLLPYVQYLLFTFLNPVGRGFQLEHDLGIGAADYKESYRLISEGMKTYHGKVIVKVPPAMIPPECMPKLFGEGKSAGCSTSCAFPTLGIVPNGDISICAVTRNDATVRFGNIKTDNLLDVWRRTRMDIIRRDYVRADKLTGICGDCTFKHTCKGACRAFAYDEFGDLNAPHPLCDALDKRGEFPNIYRLSYKQQMGVRKELPVLPMHVGSA